MGHGGSHVRIPKVGGVQCYNPKSWGGPDPPTRAVAAPMLVDKLLCQHIIHIPCHELDMALCYDFITSWRHEANCRTCVSSTRGAKTFVFFGFSNPLGGQMQYHKNYLCYVCTVDLVGQGRLTIILTILFQSLGVLER